MSDATRLDKHVGDFKLILTQHEGSSVRRRAKRIQRIFNAVERFRIREV